jgi:hypothetical protein
LFFIEGKFIIASGPVIIENRKLLVSKDNKENFYKLIGEELRKEKVWKKPV